MDDFSSCCCCCCCEIEDEGFSAAHSDEKGLASVADLLQTSLQIRLRHHKPSCEIHMRRIIEQRIEASWFPGWSNRSRYQLPR